MCYFFKMTKLKVSALTLRSVYTLCIHICILYQSTDLRISQDALKLFSKIFFFFQSLSPRPHPNPPKLRNDIKLGGGTHALHGSTSPPPRHPGPPSPISQPAFKFKRFGVQFHKKNCSCGSFFFSVTDFFFSDEVFYRYRLPRAGYYTKL